MKLFFSRTQVVLLLLLIVGPAVGQSGFKHIPSIPAPSFNGTLQPVAKIGRSFGKGTTYLATGIKRQLNFQLPGTVSAQGLIEYNQDQNSFWAKSDKPIGFNLRAAQSSVYSFLDAFKTQMKITDVNKELEYVHSEMDELNMQHITVRQVYQGVPIYGGELIIHGKNGHMDHVNGRVYPTPFTLDIHPELSLRQIENIVVTDLASISKYQEVSPALLKIMHRDRLTHELVIFYKEDHKPFLTYAISIVANGLEIWNYFVDAHTGQILKKFMNTCSFMPHDHTSFLNGTELDHPSALHSASVFPSFSFDFAGKTTTNATDLLGKSLILNTFEDGGRFYLLDATRAMFKTIGTDSEEPVGVIWTFDGKNNTPTKDNFNPGLINAPNNTGWISQTASSAHFNSGVAYDYFLNKHARNSINGKGGNIISLINIADDDGTAMDNAFWNGEAMFYGNGKDAFTPLAKALDVAGHEMSHGVVQTTANLDYESESGALNESFADIFGRLIDSDDWLIGEDVVKKSVFPTGALRSFIDPHNGGTRLGDAGYQPRTYAERYRGTEDNSGVHINSGIANWAFYQFVTRINNDLNKAEKIYYRALSRYLTRSSRFIDCRKAIIQSATDLFGATSAEVTAAKAAYDFVGILEGAATTTQQDVKTNPGTDFIAYTDNGMTKVIISDATGRVVSDPLSDKDPLSRPSVTDDGSVIIFVGKDKKIHYVVIDWAKSAIKDAGILQNDTIWRNAVVSRDGNRFAAIQHVNEDKIHVYDYTIGQNGEWKVFKLFNPTFSNGVTTGDVNYADAMEFDHTSQELMYDSENTIKNSSGADVVYWDISFLNVYNGEKGTWADGRINKLFGQLPEKTSVGNPTFSKNSPHIIAFDMLIEGATASQTTYLLLGGNVETGKIDTIFVNGQLSWPNYSKIDDRVIFNAATNTGTAVIAQIKVNNTKIRNSGTATVLVSGATLGTWFANGARNLGTGTYDAIATSYAFRLSPNPVATSQINVQWHQPKTSINNQFIIYDVNGKMHWSSADKFPSGDQRMTIPIQALASGIYFLQVQIDGKVGSIKFIRQ